MDAEGRRGESPPRTRGADLVSRRGAPPCRAGEAPELRGKPDRRRRRCAERAPGGRGRPIRARGYPFESGGPPWWTADPRSRRIERRPPCGSRERAGREPGGDAYIAHVLRSASVRWIDPLPRKGAIHLNQVEGREGAAETWSGRSERRPSLGAGTRLHAGAKACARAQCWSSAA